MLGASLEFWLSQQVETRPSSHAETMMDVCGVVVEGVKGRRLLFAILIKAYACMLSTVSLIFAVSCAADFTSRDSS